MKRLLWWCLLARNNLTQNSELTNLFFANSYFQTPKASPKHPLLSYPAGPLPISGASNIDHPVQLLWPAGPLPIFGASYNIDHLSKLVYYHLKSGDLLLKSGDLRLGHGSCYPGQADVDHQLELQKGSLYPCAHQSFTGHSWSSKSMYRGQETHHYLPLQPSLWYDKVQIHSIHQCISLQCSKPLWQISCSQTWSEVWAPNLQRQYKCQING